MEWYHSWINDCHQWLLGLGLPEHSVRLTEYPSSDLAHYARATTDIEFKYLHGWDELWGIAHRGDYDLSTHARAANKIKQFTVKDISTGESFIPNVIEPAVGLDRLVLAILTAAFQEDTVVSKRNVLRLHPSLSPFKVAVLPLQKKPELMQLANTIFDDLVDVTAADFDAQGSIGRRYRRQDEIGTPSCVTVDLQSLEDQMVTVRDRDTTNQTRIPIAELSKHI